MISLAAQPHFHHAQSAVVEVQTPPPYHFLYVQRVAEFDVVVDERGEQVVGGSHGMEIAREMQVDVLHGDYLCIPSAARAALDAEHRPERRLAQGKARVEPYPAHSVRKTYAHRGLSLSQGSGVHCGDEYELRTARPGGQGNFRLEFSVRFDLVRGVSQTRSDLRYGQRM